MLLFSSIKATTKHKLGKTYAQILISALSIYRWCGKRFFSVEYERKECINATNTTKTIDW